MLLKKLFNYSCIPSPATLYSLSLASVLSRSDNNRVSGLGFQPSPKSPSATLYTLQPLYEMEGKINKPAGKYKYYLGVKKGYYVLKVRIGDKVEELKGVF